MIKFYNNLENEEKFLAIVECLKKAANIEYEGYDVSDPLDEMNDFMDSISLIDNLNVSFWFNEIYDRWMYDGCSSLSVETINKSFEAALDEKHFYDVGNYLDGWDKGLVEYVLNEKEDFIILNDIEDYERLRNKSSAIIKCPSGYYLYELDLWRPYKRVEEDAVELLKECVEIDYYQDDDGNFIDDEGNIIDVEQVSQGYAEAFLMEVEYEDVVVEYFTNW